MHYCVYVFIPKEGDIDELVASALTPYDEDLAVPPYIVNLGGGEIAAMAKHYRVKKGDLMALAAHMQDWQGSPGFVNCNGLFTIKTYNPKGKWDWYEIGGRWRHRLRGNVLSAGTLLKKPKLRKLLPACMVTPDGQWHEWETFIVEGWMKWHVERTTDSGWLKEVRKALRRFAANRVVCVDIHR